MLPKKAEDSVQYSNDLRRKLSEALLTGENTQAELADLFHVSLGWVEKVLRRWRTTGDTNVSAPAPSRWLQRLGLPRKKRCCTPVSATRLVFSDCGRVGGRNAVAGTHAGWCLSTKRA